YDALNQRLTAHLMHAAAVATSDRVLDVGCGCGLTTRIAARAAPTGSVVGVDLSAAMLREAERRARADGLGNARFAKADAQVHSFAAEEFDLAISRFGVMFFEDPAAAFSNIASALRPHGRLVFLCWQGRDQNEWVTATVSAAFEHVPTPAPDPEGAPGPSRSRSGADRSASRGCRLRGRRHQRHRRARLDGRRRRRCDRVLAWYRRRTGRPRRRRWRDRTPSDRRRSPSAPSASRTGRDLARIGGVAGLRDPRVRAACVTERWQACHRGRTARSRPRLPRPGEAGDLLVGGAGLRTDRRRRQLRAPASARW